MEYMTQKKALAAMRRKRRGESSIQRRKQNPQEQFDNDVESKKMNDK